MALKCFKPYDVFISHAVEDREISEPLFNLLSRKGLRVWYSGQELQVGDSISKKIHKGLRKSKYGIVILSESYIKSDWGKYELGFLLSDKNDRQHLLFPLWHGLTYEDICNHYPELKDTYGLPTEKGVNFITDQLYSQLSESNILCRFISTVSWVLQTRQLLITNIFISSVFIAAFLFGYDYLRPRNPGETIIKEAIEERMLSMQKMLDKNMAEYLPTSPDSIISIRTNPPASCTRSDRHAFEFTDGTISMHSVSALKKLGIHTATDGLSNAYGFTEYMTGMRAFENNAVKTMDYLYLNKAPVSYKVVDEFIANNDEYHLVLSYQNFLRSVRVVFESRNGSCSEKIFYTGYRPQEEFIFIKDGKNWYCAGSR